MIWLLILGLITGALFCAAGVDDSRHHRAAARAVTESRRAALEAAKARHPSASWAATEPIGRHRRSAPLTYIPQPRTDGPTDPQPEGEATV